MGGWEICEVSVGRRGGVGIRLILALPRNYMVSGKLKSKGIISRGLGKYHSRLEDIVLSCYHVSHTQ